MEVAGQDLNDMCDVSKQDCAALYVAKELGISKTKACDMYDGDKIGRSAIGKLISKHHEKISCIGNTFFLNTNS